MTPMTKTTDQPDDQYASHWKLRVHQGGQEIAAIFLPPNDTDPNVALAVARAAAIALFAERGPNILVELWQWFPMHPGEPLTPQTECGEEYRFFTMGILHHGNV